MVKLEVRSDVNFDSVEEARVAGQAIERFLGTKGARGVHIYEYRDPNSESKLPFRSEVPLYLPEKPQNVTQARQETETRLSSLVKNLRSQIASLPLDADLDAGVLGLDGRRWTIDYQALFDNVAKHVEKSAEMKDAFNSAVAMTLQMEATRGIK